MKTNCSDGTPLTAGKNAIEPSLSMPGFTANI